MTYVRESKMMLTPLGVLFITHQLPKGLLVDEAVVLGKTETNQAKNHNSTEINRTE